MTQQEEQVMIKLIMVSRTMGDYILRDSPPGLYIRNLVKEAKELLLQTENGKRLIEESKVNLLHFLFTCYRYNNETDNK